MKGDACVKGAFFSENTDFQKNLEIDADRIILNNTKVQSIRIKLSGNKQILILDKGTKVSGEIVFESGKGDIFLSNDSSIAGEIAGGEVHKK